MKGTTTGSYINIREKPTTSSSVVEKTGAAGEAITVVFSDESDWFKITYKGVTGYIAARYVYVTTNYPCTVKTAGGKLNIRQTSSTSSTVLYEIANGSTMMWLDKVTSSMCMVSSKSGTGWASRDYIVVD